MSYRSCNDVAVKNSADWILGIAFEIKWLARELIHLI